MPPSLQEGSVFALLHSACFSPSRTPRLAAECIGCCVYPGKSHERVLCGTGSELMWLWCRSCREAMDKIVEVLLEKETMSGDEFRALLAEYVDIPKVPVKELATAEI